MRLGRPFGRSLMGSIRIAATVTAISGAIACSVAAADDREQLNANFAAAAAKLGESIGQELSGADVRARVLFMLKFVHDYEAIKSHRRRARAFSDGLKLSDISSTPEITRLMDDTNLPYHSELRLNFERLGTNGEPLGAKPIQFTIPVAANPQMEWVFPSVGIVIESLTTECEKIAEHFIEVESEVLGDREVDRRIRQVANAAK